MKMRYNLFIYTLYKLITVHPKVTITTQSYSPVGLLSVWRVACSSKVHMGLLLISFFLSIYSKLPLVFVWMCVYTWNLAMDWHSI